MPLQYVKMVKPLPAMRLAGMGNLGASKKKLKKHAANAAISMNISKEKLDAAMLKAEQLKVEVEELGKVLGILAEVAKTKGVPAAKIDEIIAEKKTA